MMPIKGRLTAAYSKRNEQLKQWKDSETNNTSAKIPEDKNWKVKFDEGCVFLAASSAEDYKEIERLLDMGVDINTTNIDGLTALHQACIDANLDMVTFLVEHGCDIHRGDNEGWTPLHAAASCGHADIARYLIKNGADIAAINNDGDLPIDIADSEEMENLLQQALEEKNINCEAARLAEEQRMLEDALRWQQCGQVLDVVHPQTGATALHVAAAKGYIKVMGILVKLGVEINAQDVDGWTPLHAAAHWGQKEACSLLAENLANMDVPNFNGQTCFDVADPDLLGHLEDLKKKQRSMQLADPEIAEILQRQPRPPLKRKTSVTRMSVASKTKVIREDVTAERAAIAPVLEEGEFAERKNSIDELNSPIEVSLNLSHAANNKESSEPMPNEKENIAPEAEPLSPTSEAQITKSLQPPTRDENSETQRKARAKRVRETRRSTQGVSLEDVKTAEQLIAAKAAQPKEEATKPEPLIIPQPKVLLPAESTPTSPDSPAITLPLRVKKVSRQDSKESEGVARQKRPKRRSSGVVYLDLEELGIKPSPADNAETNGNSTDTRNEAGTIDTNKSAAEDKSSTGLNYSRPTSRYGSSSHLADDKPSYTRRAGSTGSLDNVDFKRLYEEERDENKKLKEKLEVAEDELDRVKKQLTKQQQNNRFAQAEEEKKEKRRLERKLSEMEEEVKSAEKLRHENQRLKEDNEALVRVISNLSK